MTTRQEIIDTIQEGDVLVQNTYQGLSEQQAQIRVGDGGGWTAKEVLAHMAGRKPTYERLIQMARGDATSLGGGVDIDERNESMVAPRRGVSLSDLLTEFHALNQWVIEQARTLPDDMLNAIVSLPQRQVQLGDVIRGAAGTHRINHTQEVVQALAKGK